MHDEVAGPISGGRRGGLIGRGGAERKIGDGDGLAGLGQVQIHQVIGVNAGDVPLDTPIWNGRLICP